MTWTKTPPLTQLNIPDPVIKVERAVRKATLAFEFGMKSKHAVLLHRCPSRHGAVEPPNSLVQVFFARYSTGHRYLLRLSKDEKRHEQCKERDCVTFL